MKYIIDRNGKNVEEIDVPEGWVPGVEYRNLGDSKTGGIVPILSFKDGDNVMAMFMGVTHFYPDTMRPAKKTWVNG